MVQFERMGAALSRLIAALLGKGPAAAEEIRAVEHEITHSLGIGPAGLAPLAPEELVRLVQSRDEWDERWKDRIAEALMVLAQACSSELPEQAVAHRRQALAILDHINQTSDTYSFERYAMADELRAGLA